MIELMDRHSALPCYSRESLSLFPYLFLLILVANVIAAWPAHSIKIAKHSIEFNINLRIYDADTKKIIAAQNLESVELQVGSVVAEIEYVPKTRRYYLERRINTSLEETYSILVNGSGDFLRRKVKVRLRDSDTHVEIPYEIFMSNLKKLTGNVVNRIHRFRISGQIDRALALAEAGLEVSQGAGQGVINALKINYSILLSVACDKLQYNTCELAQEFLKEAKLKSQSDPLFLKKSGVTERELQNAQKIAFSVPFLETFASGKKNFMTGKYVVAATRFEKILKLSEKNKRALKITGLSSNRIHYDLGVSYLKADIAKEKRTGAKNSEYLRKALKNFGKVTDPNFERIEENASVASTRLKTFQK